MKDVYILYLHKHKKPDIVGKGCKYGLDGVFERGVDD